MISGETQLRVRYAETDQMGVVYYGNYPMYYEVGRTELIREFGLTYRSLEEYGIIMPVVYLKCKYKKPAFYDDLISIHTQVPEMPGVRIRFEDQLYNQKGDLINTGSTELVFMDDRKNRPCKPPEFFIDTIKSYF